MSFPSPAPTDASDSTVPDVPFTVIVVTYNEDRRLGACLENLSFAQQLLVVDIGSEDRSIEIAKDSGADVLHHEHLPVVEQVRARVIEEATHDWVLFIDPDEVFHPALAERAAAVIANTEDVGRISLPWQFYFRGEPLQGTRWGGRKHKGILIHKDRCKLTTNVHRGIGLKDGYQSIRVPWEEPDHHIRHFWVDSFKELFSKHQRYIQHEGESRFNAGVRFSRRKLLLQPPRSFKRSFIDKSGWRDGGTGLFLSLFNAWYEGMSLLSLREYQRHHATS